MMSPMKKLLAIIIIGLSFCNIAIADCGLPKELEREVHWSGDSAWRFEFFNQNSETITITKIHYYKTGTGVSSEPYRTYDVSIRVRANSEKSYVHRTNMNYDLIKSWGISCQKTFSSSNSSNFNEIRTKKKESWFKWWYILVGLFVLGVLGNIIDGMNKPKSKKTKLVRTSQENIIEIVWEGRETMSKTFWLYCILATFVISFIAGLLLEVIGVITLIAPAAIIVWSNTGLWRSSEIYKNKQLNNKQPYGWAIAAKVYVVLNYITTVSQIGSFLILK